MIEIQAKMATRCLQMLELPPHQPAYLLDIGCGSGLSGDVLSEAGHMWVGMDISKAMLSVAVERDVDGDVFEADMGHGLFFRPGVFDGCISVSALQWLCNADQKWHKPRQRLIRFFTTLYAALRRGSRAVFQLYPMDPQQMELITSAAIQCGFNGGLVVDFPHSRRAKKLFLVLRAGAMDGPLPRAEDGVAPEDSDGDNFPQTVGNLKAKKKNQERRRDGKNRPNIRERVMQKKERRRFQGKDTAADSKYTARKRKPRF